MFNMIKIFGLKNNNALHYKGSMSPSAGFNLNVTRTFDLEDDEQIAISTKYCAHCNSEQKHVEITKLEVEYYDKDTDELVKTRDVKPYLIHLLDDDPDVVTNVYKDDKIRAQNVRDGYFLWPGRYRTTENFI